MTLDLANIPNKRSPILLVEDRPEDAELTEIAFNKSGIVNPLVWVQDGVFALDYLLHRAAYADLPENDHPILVLLDINLPRVNGFEVLDEVKRHPDIATIPFLVLTSSKEDEDIANSYHRGCNSFIRKPVDFDLFIDVIRHTGIYWLLINQQVYGVK